MIAYAHGTPPKASDNKAKLHSHKLLIASFLERGETHPNRLPPLPFRRRISHKSDALSVTVITINSSFGNVHMHMSSFYTLIFFGSLGQSVLKAAISCMIY